MKKSDTINIDTLPTIPNTTRSRFDLVGDDVPDSVVGDWVEMTLGVVDCQGREGGAVDTGVGIIDGDMVRSWLEGSTVMDVAISVETEVGDVVGNHVTL